MNGIFVLILPVVSSLLLDDPCPNNCRYNGRCSGQSCRCYEGFYGSDCQGDCGCNGHGTCAADKSCKCDQGWKWDTHQHQCVWNCHCPHGVACIGPGECDCIHTCKYGACRNGQCVCWEGYKGDSCTQYDPNIMMNHNVAVGINIAGNDFFIPEMHFVDLHKESESWLTQRVGNHAWDTKEQNKVTWRSDGYPARLEPTMKLVQLVLRTFGSHEASGNYTILYDGEGEIGIGLTQHTVVYDGKGRMVVNIPKVADAGILVELLKTNQHNPLHNIRVISPGYENIYQRFPFHPTFLENLKRFSEIRFMDFLNTKDHQPEPTVWSSRRKVDYYTQIGPYGAALEYVTQLANQVGANPWVNVPHAADNNFVWNMAQLIKKDLRPDLKVYVEYSNEVWNGIFRQAAYSREQGRKLQLDTNDAIAGMKFYCKRAAEVAQIWNQVFGAEKSRVYPVFAWQTGFQDYFRQAVEALGSKINNFKALAVTGYFSCNELTDKNGTQMLNMSNTQIYQYCEKTVPSMQSLFQYYVNLAKTHHLQLVMYEGGPSIMQNNVLSGASASQAITNKAIAFNRDTHMQQLVVDVMNSWYQTVTQVSGNSFPGGLFNYFDYTSTFSKYGSWGMLEYTGQNPNTSPKFKAVQQFITSHYGHNVLGPKCSFIKSKSLTYGCFQQSAGNFKCGQTTNHGRSWNFFPSFGQRHGQYVVLDGFDPETHKLFVRRTDTLGINTYHVYSTASHSWGSLQTLAYYEQAATNSLVPRMPNGVYQGLNAHAMC